MPHFRRCSVAGAMYFFTVVTHRRRPIFRDAGAVGRLTEAMRSVRERSPYRSIGLVVLPDHLHCIWQLPRGDHDYPGRWRRLKWEFTIRWLATGGPEARREPARQRRGERGVWQRRYWEHLIRDDRDLAAHLDYLHYNPVKHGLARWPSEWPWSTYHRFERLGHYAPGWGASEPHAPHFDVGE